MKRLISSAVCLTALMISVFILNCSDEDSPLLPAHIPVAMPLAVGNVWNYADTAVGPTSAAFNSSFTVTGDTVISHESLDYEVFTVEHFEDFNRIPTTYFLRNDEFGLWEFGTGCDMDSMFYKHMNAKYPTDIGDEWIKGWFQCDPNQYVTGYPPGDARCISVDSLYTTLAGTFECYVYHSQHEIMMFGTFDIYTFYALDIGMVAREIQADMIYWKSSLIDYELK